MRAAYATGDPYLAFAVASGLAPPGATKASHSLARERCKVVCLGVLYGMEAQGLAYRLGVSLADAESVLAQHKRTYPDFWRWADSAMATARLHGLATTRFGWPLHVSRATKAGTLKNFPMQANAAEMMRLAAIAATEAGLGVCAPIHDAFLLMAPAERLDEDVARVQSIMHRAALAVLGLAVRTDVATVRWPDRYVDSRGTDMWRRVVGLLEALPAAETAA